MRFQESLSELKESHKVVQGVFEDVEEVLWILEKIPGNFEEVVK